MTDLEILKSKSGYCKPYMKMKLSQPPMFGFKTKGLEYLLSNAVFAACQGTQRSPYVLFEIGTAHADSTRAFYSILKENPAYFAPFSIVSCDLPDGWSLNTQSIVKNLPEARIHFELSEYDYGNTVNDVSVILQPSHDILSSRKIPHINFAFVDGCHGYNCAMQDWRDVDALMPPGGVIVFHDADPACQGSDIQPHCGEPIRVREAVIDIVERHGDEYVLLADAEADFGNNGVIILQKKEK